MNRRAWLYAFFILFCTRKVLFYVKIAGISFNSQFWRNYNLCIDFFTVFQNRRNFNLHLYSSRGISLWIMSNFSDTLGILLFWKTFKFWKMKSGDSIYCIWLASERSFRMTRYAALLTVFVKNERSVQAVLMCSRKDIGDNLAHAQKLCECSSKIRILCLLSFHLCGEFRWAQINRLNFYRSGFSSKTPLSFFCKGWTNCSFSEIKSNRFLMALQLVDFGGLSSVLRIDIWFHRTIQKIIFNLWHSFRCICQTGSFIPSHWILVTIFERQSGDGFENLCDIFYNIGCIVYFLIF